MEGRRSTTPGRSTTPARSTTPGRVRKTSGQLFRESISRIMSRVNMEDEDTFTPSGDFERDFYELCQKNGITSIKVAPRPHRPSSPSVFHPETSMSKGKESKEDKHKNAAHAEPPKVDSTDNEHEQLPLTYRTKDKFDYFKPKVEIETEDEGYKTHVKEIYIRGWKVDKKITDILAIILPKQERLTTLDLWNTGFTDETLEALAKAISSNHMLKNLRLDGNSYVLHHRYDAFLKEDSPVQNLSLKNCYINDIGAKNIGDALVANKNLVTLNLCFNKVTCEGAEHIAKGLRMNRTLLSLNLGSNLIGDKGTLKIAEALSRFSLTHEEVVQRRMLLSKKNAEEPSSPTRSLGHTNPGPRPPSVKSGAHLNKDQKANKERGGNKKGLKESLTPKGGKDSSTSKKASQADVSVKSSSKSSKNKASNKPDKTRPRELEPESPELFEFPHPLLETTETINGEIWVPGNRSLINLNLARNKLGEEGIKALYSAVQQQIAITSQSGRTVGIGLLRLSVQRNYVSSEHSVYTQLSELMLTRDPFYKPPPVTPSGESTKDERTD